MKVWNAKWQDDPKRWYNVRKCGCATTSTNHPWVRMGVSLSGEYVQICTKHGGHDEPVEKV